jgi:hypothetical protein
MISTSDPSCPPPPALRARILRWARGPTFSRDIAFVLAFKLVLLMALKYAFFNHPQAENMNMPPAEVARAILSVSVPSATGLHQGHQSYQSYRSATQGDQNAH